ncbi:Meiotic nuclear division protein [Sphaerulina musiva]
MAPKVNCNPQKLATIQSWFRQSKTVWNLKELEKQLPSVASINGMQTKDYIQSLQDDNKISCEKIGSGNWYWDFQTERAKKTKSAFAALEAECERVAAINLEFEKQLNEQATILQAEMDAAEFEGPSRPELEIRKLDVAAEIEAYRLQVASYKKNDPTELENERRALRVDFDEAEMATEDIYALESWFKKQGAEALVETFPEQYYTPLDQWNEEEGQLKEEELDSEVFDQSITLGSPEFVESLFAL